MAGVRVDEWEISRRSACNAITDIAGHWSRERLK